MSDRVNWYHRQRVTEAELDLAFTQLEQADRHLATDLNVFGIISGALPTEHAPIPDLSIDLTGPARAYDRLGQRIYFAVGQTVDLSVDSTGMPTEVVEPGNERWLGVFLKFDRALSDPRTDGNSQTVYFRRDEFFQVVVKMGAEAPIGQAERVELEPDALLVADVRLRHGQKQRTSVPWSPWR